MLVELHEVHSKEYLLLELIEQFFSNIEVGYQLLSSGNSSPDEWALYQEVSAKRQENILRALADGLGVKRIEIDTFASSGGEDADTVLLGLGHLKLTDAIFDKVPANDKISIVVESDRTIVTVAFDTDPSRLWVLVDHNLLLNEGQKNFLIAFIDQIGTVLQCFNVLLQHAKDNKKLLALINATPSRPDLQAVEQSSCCSGLSPLYGRLKNKLSGFLISRYQLTGSEIALAVNIWEGASLKLIARSSGRSVETIRVQLKSIYKKTGLSDQKSVCMLIYSFMKGFYSEELVDNVSVVSSVE